MVLPKKWAFFHVFTFGKIGIGIKKTPFKAIKKKSSNSQKINISPKGLTDNFGPEMAIFPTFFFRQYRPGKCFERYSRTKKRLSSL